MSNVLELYIKLQAFIDKTAPFVDPSKMDPAIVTRLHFQALSLSDKLLRSHGMLASAKPEVSVTTRQ
jgi:hypothetical protein